MMNMRPSIRPELDRKFCPSVLWNRAYRNKVEASGSGEPVSFRLLRPDGTCSVFDARILHPDPSMDHLTLRFLERMLKFLLWQRGASKVFIAGCDAMASALASIYSPAGARSFDHAFFGSKVYLGQPFDITACSTEGLPAIREGDMRLGRHLHGCRIGFDLGGSDRKCAAVIDGRVVFSEEVAWNPYFESDPQYHIDGVEDSLRRAAAHLPRVDAIGGSAAGVYVNNEVRVASLFRGVSAADFERKIRRMFHDIRKRWGDIPFEVVNDGEVTALAGSMSMNTGAVLGISLGTSQAAGYVTPQGNITAWLNELAFAPVDYREDAPIDEWSGDRGCGVQYFSQQAVARLAPAAGIDFPPGTPFPEQLVRVQELMAVGDQRAASIYNTIGTYLGYTIAHYADFYEIRKVLLLGRVMSGKGGTLIIQQAGHVLAAEFPDVHQSVDIVTPDEKDKRHGQAVAAASLPSTRECQ